MKTHHYFFIFALCIMLCSIACKKHSSQPTNPADQLPPATTTGANTIGCLVNGKALLPAGLSLAGGNKHATYQWGYDNAWHLAIGIGNQNSNGIIQSVGVHIDSLKIEVGKSYNLDTLKNGNASAGYLNTSFVFGAKAYPTSSSNSWATGQLTITRFDTVNQIVSENFWFNALDQYGDSVRVTNGRFDMIFSY